MFRWLTVVWFAALLAIPGVLSLVRDAPTSVDNRLAREFPELDADGVWFGDAFNAIDGHLQDRLAIRGQAVRLHADFSYRLLRDSTHPDVLVGEGDWLYYGPVFWRPCDDAAVGQWPNPGQLIGNLESARERLEAVDVDFFVTRVVEKGFVETENLPGALPGLDCTAALQQAMRDAFATSDITIDLWSVFEQAASPDRPLFWQRDTHWNDRGRLLAVQTLIDAMAPGVWDGEPVDGPPREIVGGLANLIGIDTVHAGPTVSVTRPVITERTRRDEWIRCYTSSGDAPLVPGRTVILTDSHLWRSEAVLAPWFEELCVLNWRGANNQVGAAAAGDADRILLSLTARESGSLNVWADRLATWAER